MFTSTPAGRGLNNGTNFNSPIFKRTHIEILEILIDYIARTLLRAANSFHNYRYPFYSDLLQMTNQANAKNTDSSKFHG